MTDAESLLQSAEALLMLSKSGKGMTPWDVEIHAKYLRSLAVSLRKVERTREEIGHLIEDETDIALQNRKLRDEAIRAGIVADLRARARRGRRWSCGY